MKLLRAYKVENIFLLTLIVFVGAKLLKLPTFYPLLAILPFFLQKEAWTYIRSKRTLIFAWAFLGLYALVSFKFFNPWVVSAMFLIPTYFLALTYLKSTRGFNKDHIINACFWMSLCFVAFLGLGILKNLKEIEALWNWSHISSGFLRHDDSLRQVILHSLLPWTPEVEPRRAYISLLGIMMTCLALLGPRGKKGIIAMILLFGLNTFAMSRTPLLASLGILILSWISTTPLRAKLLIASCVLVTPVILSLSALTLNGRRPIWDSIMSDLNWKGHGVGAAAALTENYCKTTGKNPVIIYPHNIHLELIYDWGWILFAFVLIPSIYFLFKNNAARTSFVVFVILAMNYSIFSPWSAWFLLFAFWRDQEAFAVTTKASPKVIFSRAEVIQSSLGPLSPKPNYKQPEII